ncbi:hypothetical protein INT45_010949 [Circinella minor]|uniref:Tc1-like transposase DDE domain-containing protein n=1 Tax=Circinella minor TaxID=1195481 RepID=A0A8H7RD63_9FUNG|nr:hypothetical protein INT45_010949 [Circinella minor]
MQTVTFYHYQSSGDYVRDGPDSETEDKPQKTVTIKTIHKLEHLSDDCLSSDDDDDSSITIHDISMEESELGLVSNPDLVWTPTKYKPAQVARFVSLIQNKNWKLKEAAKETGIEPSAAYKFNRQWKDNGGCTLPGYVPALELKPKQNNIKLIDEHSQFLESYVDEHLTCIIKDATHELCKAFEGLTINQSTVYRHVTEKLSFSLTQTQPKVAEQNSEDTIEARCQFVEYIIDNEIDFKKKCVFVDESRFKKNMVRPVTWSKKGEPADVEVPTQQGVNLSVLGCMSYYGLIALSQQVPKSSGLKKRKIVSKRSGLPHGTSSSHFLLFVREMSSVLKKVGLNNMYIVMDNAGIHKTAEVLQAVRDHGHTPLFLPPYSLFLNPIEECWAQIKREVRKTPLEKNEILATHIEEAAKIVTTKNCKGYIRHSYRYFNKCINMERT